MVMQVSAKHQFVGSIPTITFILCEAYYILSIDNGLTDFSVISTQIGALSMEPNQFILGGVCGYIVITGFVKLYREKGLNVMPLKPKSKFPFLDEWKQYQTEKYNGDFDPNQNGAVICGESSGGLIVIDLDDKALADTVFKDFEGLKKKTLVVETGKGYHIYTKPKGSLPDISIRTINENGQRVDIQCQGTYVLIPGSIHPDTGKEYKIISSTLDIDEIDLDGFIKNLGSVGFNIEGKRKKIVEILKGVKEGERNDSVFRLAMGLRHSFGYKAPELLYHCGVFNEHLVFPPLSDLEIKNIVQSAISYDINEIRFKEVLEEASKPLKELHLKYDDKFWKIIEDHCKKAGVSTNALLLYCDSGSHDMPNDPQNDKHKSHIITIKYK